MVGTWVVIRREQGRVEFEILGIFYFLSWMMVAWLCALKPFVKQYKFSHYDRFENHLHMNGVKTNKQIHTKTHVERRRKPVFGVIFFQPLFLFSKFKKYTIAYLIPGEFNIFFK